MSHIPILGIGAVCSAGYGVNTGYKAISEGIDSLSPLSLFECGLKETPPCGEVKEELVDKTVPNRTIGLAMPAVQEALAPVNNPFSKFLVYAYRERGFHAVPPGI